jgi:peptidoglycan/LPS O-acetylase OafA/YrhL
MTRVDRAAMVLGVASLASVGVAQFKDRYAVLELRSWSIAVAVILGLAAIVAGLIRQRWAVIATGAVFLVAAVVQVPVWGGNNWLGGNGGAAALWLGLGVGLLALGLTDRNGRDDHDR